MKKLLSTTLCICITVISMVQFMVTPSARTSGDYDYSALDDGTIQITKYTGSDTTLTVPSEIDGYTVTEIGWYAFRNCRELENVILSESITSIGREAFYGTAYYNNESNWENGILYLSNCLIATKSTDINGKVVIKPETRIIADYAFCECENMTEIELPEGLISIGDSAFFECTSLTSLYVPDSVIHIKKLQIIDYNALDKSESKLQSVVIGNGITTIPANMFKSCSNLTNVTLGNNVKIIENEAFAYTSIVNINIPDSVETIEYRAFFCCDFLANIELGKGIKSIDSSAFDGENISKVTYAGNSMQWEHVVIEDHNDKIKENVEFLEDDTAFSDTHIESDQDYPKEKTPVLTYIIVFLVIVIIGVAVILLLKKRGNSDYENK
ncbi:MAG: leucine-rich repeat domain-containing protein [Clostridia bacterium]|nr:leucine-rich repeat domain-containing protein [Clostridia bacterium]